MRSRGMKGNACTDEILAGLECGVYFVLNLRPQGIIPLDGVTKSPTKRLTDGLILLGI
jgi:hypothetical protein